MSTYTCITKHTTSEIMTESNASSVNRRNHWYSVIN